MEIQNVIAVFLLVPTLSYSTYVLQPISNLYLPYGYEPDGITGRYGIDKDAVEQSGYDVSSGLVYAAGASYIHIVDYSDINNPIVLDKIPTSPTTDVELCGSRVAFSIMGATPDQNGEIHVYNLYDTTTGRFDMAYDPIIVGIEPDMLHFSKDCNTIVVANEGTPYATATDIIDPEGAVSIITLSAPVPNVKTLNFTSFNARADEYVSRGVRWHYRGEISLAPTTFSQSLEPEFITYNSDETKVYVTLQENNAIAEVNLVTATIDEIYPLGAKSWRNLVIDASDKDAGISLQNYDIKSLYQPDSIKFLKFNGNDYIITANEGDTLELETGGKTWSDFKKGRLMVEDGQISPDVDANLLEALKDDSRLGRLLFSVVDGQSSTNPALISDLNFLGGRGFSIFRANDFSLFWDSEDEVERLHSKEYPKTFNGNTKPDDPAKQTPSDLADSRSSKQGPECESLEIAELEDGTRLIFVGVDRSSSILIYSLTSGDAIPLPKFESIFRDGGTDETFNALLESRNLGNLDPEDIRFIPASYSSTGSPLLLITSSVSGSLAMYEVVNIQGSSGVCLMNIPASTVLMLVVGLVIALWNERY